MLQNLKNILEFNDIFFYDNILDINRIANEYVFKIYDESFFKSKYYNFFCKLFSIKSIRKYEIIRDEKKADIIIDNDSDAFILFGCFYFDNMISYKKRDHMTIIISQTCNENCKYCLRKKDDLLPLNFQVNNFLSYLKTLENIKEISISGGEPTLYKNLDRMILKIHELGKKINSISTNNINYYNKLIERHHYHFIKDIVGKNIITFDDTELLPIKYINFFLNTLFEQKASRDIFLNGVLTSRTLDGIIEIFSNLSMENINNVIFRIERTNDFCPIYKVNDEELKKIPQCILKTDLIFHIRNMILRQWIGYNISTDEIYLNSSHIQYKK